MIGLLNSVLEFCEEAVLSITCGKEDEADDEDVVLVVPRSGERIEVVDTEDPECSVDIELKFKCSNDPDPEPFIVGIRWC